MPVITVMEVCSNQPGKSRGCGPATGTWQAPGGSQFSGDGCTGKRARSLCQQLLLERLSSLCFGRVPEAYRL